MIWGLTIRWRWMGVGVGKGLGNPPWDDRSPAAHVAWIGIFLPLSYVWSAACITIDESVHVRSDAERHVAACKTAFCDVSARRVPSLRHLDTSVRAVATRRADTSGGHDSSIRRVASRVSDTSNPRVEVSLRHTESPTRPPCVVATSPSSPPATRPTESCLVV